MSYRLARRAATDLRGVWSYVASDSRQGADSLIDSILPSCDFLGDNPHCGEASDFGPEGLRCHAVPNTAYLIYFLPTADGVEIARIAHGTRDNLASLFRRR